MELGEFDSAINSLIELLNLNPTNEFALTVVGNIYVTHKKDFETAITYYNQVLALNTKNFIGINNIGGIIAKQRNFDEAKKYFLKALAVNNGYSNALYGLALTEHNLGNVLDAFEFARQAVLSPADKKNSEEQTVNENSWRLMVSLVKEYLSGRTVKEICSKFLYKLKEECGKDIEIIIYPEIQTPAKIRIDEYHNLSRHEILLK